jgi:WD40 repeat protein
MSRELDLTKHTWKFDSSVTLVIPLLGTTSHLILSTLSQLLLCCSNGPHYKILDKEDVLAFTVAAVPGKKFLTGERELDHARLWLVEDDVIVELRTFLTGKIFSGIEVLPRDRFAFAGPQGQINIWTMDGEQEASWSSGVEDIDNLLPLPGDRLAQSHSADLKEIYIWDVPTCTCLQKLTTTGLVGDMLWHQGMILATLESRLSYLDPRDLSLISEKDLGSALFQILQLSSSLFLFTLMTGPDVFLSTPEGETLIKTEAKGVVEDMCQLGNGNVVLALEGNEILLLDICGDKWRKVACWLFVGRQDEESVYYGLPIEVVFAIVEAMEDSLW